MGLLQPLVWEEALSQWPPVPSTLPQSRAAHCHHTRGEERHKALGLATHRFHLHSRSGSVHDLTKQWLYESYYSLCVTVKKINKQTLQNQKTKQTPSFSLHVAERRGHLSVLAGHLISRGYTCPDTTSCGSEFAFGLSEI